jgi:hypothetical protein
VAASLGVTLMLASSEVVWAGDGDGCDAVAAWTQAQFEQASENSPAPRPDGEDAACHCLCHCGCPGAVTALVANVPTVAALGDVASAPHPHNVALSERATSAPPFRPA